MGSGSSQPMTNNEKPGTTPDPTEAPHPVFPDPPAILYKIYPYLLVAFVAGVLLTLLVICLIKKSCSKNPTSSSLKISPVSHKCCPSAEENFSSADMSLGDSGENRVYFAQHEYEEQDPIVYAQIKVKTKTSLPNNGSEEIR
ncbi:transmembrane protein C1orf162 homolog [Notamacropus eugenii]|uniref:transmembrane protein C1orf162 homolog n=1 Tax=Notamacropus eugenii TaxID=9315 RepID=UPI003B67862B